DSSLRGKPIAVRHSKKFPGIFALPVGILQACDELAGGGVMNRLAYKQAQPADTVSSACQAHFGLISPAALCDELHGFEVTLDNQIVIPVLGQACREVVRSDEIEKLA